MKEHHTKEKGDIGFQSVTLDLTKKGYKVFTSNSEHLPFDLVAYKDKVFTRIQVKYRKSDNGKITLFSKTIWADKNGNHRNPYDKSEIDYFAIYCPDTDECYYINPETFGKSITIRLGETRNGQKSGVNFSDDYLNLGSVETIRETSVMMKM